MSKTLIRSAFAAALLFSSAARSFGSDLLCGIAILPNKALVKAIIKRSQLTAFTGNSKVRPFLEGIQPQLFNGDINKHQGSVLFIKRSIRWALVAPKDGEQSQGIFVSSQSDDVFIVTMISTEGPGPDYTLVRANAKLNRFDCLTLPFPDSIESPGEYLSLEDFNMDARGNGKLTGSATIDRGGPQQVWWFQYTTNDFGRSWSAPARVASQPVKIPGIFKASALRPDEPLKLQMERYFGIR